MRKTIKKLNIWPQYFLINANITHIFIFKVFVGIAGYKWAESLNFQRIVTSRLNPLRVCLPIVVKTFASLTR